MKLTVEQLQNIERYIDADRVDTGKLIKYLEKHKTVKNDIFAPCSKIPKKSFRDEAYCTALESDRGFRPVSRDVFLRRIPFYFYTVQSADGDTRYSPLWRQLPSRDRDRVSDEEMEAFYEDLEFMYYGLNIPLAVMFDYVHAQLHTPVPPRQKPSPSSEQHPFATIAANIASASISGDNSYLSTRGVFAQWRHYLHLCNELGWTDYTPDRFIAAYNYALEASGLEPVIYHPIIQLGIVTHTTDRNTFVYKGNFPCDPDGKPVLRWTTIKVTEPESVTFNAEKSRFGELTIVASPRTMLYERGVVYDEDDNLSIDLSDYEWERVYAGPQNMSFNRFALKEYREACGLTQKQLAEAIDVSVRTYQKWEAGKTMPDCHNLIRIMNWLGIRDVQSLIAYDDV